MSFDNTGSLSANTWRHVAFIEQTPSARPAATPSAAPSARPAAPRTVPQTVQQSAPGAGTACASAGHAGAGNAGIGHAGAVHAGAGHDVLGDTRWLMSSDVCKHCTHAACLDVCPTGSLLRTEFGTVVVQEDICNGCGYCVPACPYGVIDQRPGDGRAWKCTLCYDRIGDGLTPACAKACPTESIQYGEVAELRDRARRRVDALHAAGESTARLYGHDPTDGVGGDGAFFLLLDEPEVYGLPPDPVVTTRDLPAMWRRAGLAALAMTAAVVVSFAGGNRR
jgi:formate dehydrogenase iron-sulfur subunit